MSDFSHLFPINLHIADVKERLNHSFSLLPMFSCDAAIVVTFLISMSR
jgi:hypothetical protein